MVNCLPAVRLQGHRGHHRHHRALPAGPDGPHPRLRQAQEGADEDQVRAQAAGEGLRRHLRHLDLPGAGHAGARRSWPATRSAAPICSAARWARRTRRRWPRSARNSSKGCRELNGIDEKKANEIFDLLEKFAGYGFNKCHSAAYGWVSYQTAYLKANYPVEFMAAVLSNEISNTDKISDLRRRVQADGHRASCRRM